MLRHFVSHLMPKVSTVRIVLFTNRDNKKNIEHYQRNENQTLLFSYISKAGFLKVLWKINLQFSYSQYTKIISSISGSKLF